MSFATQIYGKSLERQAICALIYINERGGRNRQRRDVGVLKYDGVFVFLYSDGVYPVIVMK